MLSPQQEQEVRGAAKEWQRRAFRHGLLIGIALGVVGALMVFGLVH
jgi:hypothetical protein